MENQHVSCVKPRFQCPWKRSQSDSLPEGSSQPSIPPSILHWVVWNIDFIFPELLGMSSSHWTNSNLFQRGRLNHPATKFIEFHDFLSSNLIMKLNFLTSNIFKSTIDFHWAIDPLPILRGSPRVSQAFHGAPRGWGNVSAGQSIEVFAVGTPGDDDWGFSLGI